MPRVLTALALALCLAACANPEETPTPKPDAGEVEPDAGTRDAGTRDGGVAAGGLVLRSVNLAPATGRAESPGHQLNGRLRVTTSTPATSDAHELRGGIVPGVGR